MAPHGWRRETWPGPASAPASWRGAAARGGPGACRAGGCAAGPPCRCRQTLGASGATASRRPEGVARRPPRSRHGAGGASPGRCKPPALSWPRGVVKPGRSPRAGALGLRDAGLGAPAPAPPVRSRAGASRPGRPGRPYGGARPAGGRGWSAVSMPPTSPAPRAGAGHGPWPAPTPHREPQSRSRCRRTQLTQATRPSRAGRGACHPQRGCSPPGPGGLGLRGECRLPADSCGGPSARHRDQSPPCSGPTSPGRERARCGRTAGGGLPEGAGPGGASTAAERGALCGCAARGASPRRGTALTSWKRAARAAPIAVGRLGLRAAPRARGAYDRGPRMARREHAARSERARGGESGRRGRGARASSPRAGYGAPCAHGRGQSHPRRSAPAAAPSRAQRGGPRAAGGGNNLHRGRRVLRAGAGVVERGRKRWDPLL